MLGDFGMNDIEQLVKIVISLGGRASIEAITHEYCKVYHMVEVPGYKSTVIQTIKNNPGKLVEDSLSHEWIVKVKPQLSHNPNSNELLMGSPEWFFEKRSDNDIEETVKKLVEMRQLFIDEYHPNKLAVMDASVLLDKIFRTDRGMIWKLTMDDKGYRWFGAAGKYAYLWPLRYNSSDNTYVSYIHNKGTDINREDAENRAIEIRNMLIQCCDIIEKNGEFQSIDDYELLDEKASSVEIFRSMWALKYCQMIFPEVFPQMYADQTINRALRILGLKKHSNNRVVNMGELALFTKRCGITGDDFQKIYGKYWGWDGDPGPCEYAKETVSKQ